MHRLKMFAALALVSLTLMGCEAVAEPPISDETVTLTFTGEFNETVDPLDVPLGRPADLPEVTGEGAFLGWFDADNPRYELTPFDPVFEDMTLVAV